jgi:hypothetical protein
MDIIKYNGYEIAKKISLSTLCALPFIVDAKKSNREIAQEEAGISLCIGYILRNKILIEDEILLYQNSYFSSNIEDTLFWQLEATPYLNLAKLGLHVGFPISLTKQVIMQKMNVLDIPSQSWEKIKEDMRQNS